MTAEALHDCFRRLLPHLDAARIALTGSIAIGLHLGGTRRDRLRSIVANDVDFVANDPDAVRPSATIDFLVSHYHLPHAGYEKFLIQLVDPATHIRLDFFPDVSRALSHAKVADVAGHQLRVLEAQDVLAHKLTLLSGASSKKPVDKKHYLHAQQLAVLCGGDVPVLPASHLVFTQYSQDTKARCLRCEVSQCESFRLAPKRAILNILGYV
jgi:hypothetical protein